MKYTKTNPPLVCMMTQSTCYRQTTHPMQIRGVLWHSTGANNPTLKRYVQPDDKAPDREKLLAILGVNGNKNDWNHIEKQAGLNAWVGKLADGTVSCVQTMPWDYKPWGCGGGCNNGWIQFEICEDALTDKAYFDAAYKEACELTAYLCTLYNIDPCGTVQYSGKTIPTILCHHDSYKLGMGSNHGDIDHWFPKFGKSMETVREDVAKLMGKPYKAVTVNTKTVPTVSAKTVSVTMPQISFGATGDSVEALQTLLNGYGFNCGEADGVWGEKTDVAVKLYQKANKLVDDGVVGKDTWAKLLT